ncbi:MAG: porphobilinogen synthase [Candidatus Omnitrophota bacterium]
MHKLKRLRASKAMRDLTAQVNLGIHNLVMPYFVREGKKIRQPIEAMPGVFRFSQDELLKEVEQLRLAGVHSLILFGLPGEKDDAGLQAYSENGVIQKAVRALKKNFGDELAIITDVCLCGYTKYGHCGVIEKSHQVTRSQSHKIKIDNNKTINILAKIALSHARAGADIVAPSSMMDGQVQAIREELDKNGFSETAIMGYSAKFASNFYGPFREAAGSGMKFGDRKSYQMDFRSSDEALREIEADIQEGADIVMVKPALAYLDIIAKAKERFAVPLAAFNVSGEYAMVKAYCEKLEVGSLKLGMEKEMALEILTAIKRAGADIIITYWAKDAAKWLKNL